MHAVVVGANGLVGSRLAALLLKQGHQVTGFGRGPQRSGSGAYVSVDLSEGTRLQTLLADARPDVIINCSAMTDVDGCEREPEKAYVANVEGVAALCRGAKASGD